MRITIFAMFIALIFSACSSKKYYEPEVTSSNIELNKMSMPSSIKSMNKVGATLNNDYFITKDGVSNIKLPVGFEFINLTDDGRVIATNYLGKILIGENELELKDVVIAASLKENKLAVIYSNNVAELIDINSSKTLFKEYSKISLANDTRVANPVFMGNLILFPTLNGKVLVVSNATNEALRNIAVDLDSEFNNIIYLGVERDSESLIIATNNKIVSVSARDIVSKSYDIRDIVVKNGYVYIGTVDGYLIKLTISLDEVAKRKYKYAKFHTLAFSDSLYAVESQGFLINVSEDFNSDTVYKFSFDNESKLIAIDNKIYYNSNFITLP